MHVEHFLFFPVVVLVAMVLIALTWKLLLRLLLFFCCLLLIWYGFSFIGFLPSPIQVLKEYRSHPHKSSQYAHHS